MDTIAAILSRLSTVAVFGLILTGFTASISTVANAQELNVAMLDTRAATELTNTDDVDEIDSRQSLAAEMIEEVREDLARRLRSDMGKTLKPEKILIKP